MNHRLGALLAAFVLISCASVTAQAPDANDQGTMRGRFGRDFKGIAGQIAEIKGDTLIVKTEQGTQTVKTTDKTAFRRDGVEAKLTDFKVGEFVFVGGQPGSNNTWTAALVGTRRQGGGMMGDGQFSPDQMGKKFVVGEVLKIDGTKITIKRPDGVEQTIEVDEDTSFRKSRTESITLADIKVGDRIGGRGELKNGVFVPTVLNVGLPQRMGHGGRGMMQRQPEGAPGKVPTQVPKESKEDKQ